MQSCFQDILIHVHIFVVVVVVVVLVILVCLFVYISSVFQKTFVCRGCMNPVTGTGC